VKWTFIYDAKSIVEAVSSAAVCRTWSNSVEATPGLCDIRHCTLYHQHYKCSQAVKNWVRLAGLKLRRYQVFGNTMLCLKRVTDIQVKKKCYEEKKGKKYAQQERKFLDLF